MLKRPANVLIKSPTASMTTKVNKYWVSATAKVKYGGTKKKSKAMTPKKDATIEGIRHRSDTSVFQRVQIDFRLTGPSQSEAFDLVDHYKRR